MATKVSKSAATKKVSTRKPKRTWSLYIQRAMKDVNKDISLSGKSMKVVNSFVNDIFEPRTTDVSPCRGVRAPPLKGVQENITLSHVDAIRHHNAITIRYRGGGGDVSGALFGGEDGVGGEAIHSLCPPGLQPHCTPSRWRKTKMRYPRRAPQSPRHGPLPRWSLMHHSISGTSEPHSDDPISRHGSAMHQQQERLALPPASHRPDTATTLTMKRNSKFNPERIGHGEEEDELTKRIATKLTEYIEKRFKDLIPPPKRGGRGQGGRGGRGGRGSRPGSQPRRNYVTSPKGYNVRSASGARSKVTTGLANPTNNNCATIAILAAIHEMDQDTKEEFGTHPNMQALTNHPNPTNLLACYNYIFQDGRYAQQCTTIHPNCNCASGNIIAQATINYYPQVDIGRRPDTATMISGLSSRVHTCPNDCDNGITHTIPHMNYSNFALIYLPGLHVDGSIVPPHLRGIRYEGASVPMDGFVFTITSIVCHRPPEGNDPGHFYCVIPRGQRLFLKDDDKEISFIPAGERDTHLSRACLVLMAKLHYSPAAPPTTAQPPASAASSSQPNTDNTPAKPKEKKQQTLNFPNSSAQAEKTGHGNPFLPPRTGAGHTRGLPTAEAPAETAPLTVMSLNINSLHPTKSKLIETLGYDAILLQETKGCTVAALGYKMFSYARPDNKRGGGVAILVRTGLKTHRVKTGEQSLFAETVCVEIHRDNQPPIRLASVYLPPPGKPTLCLGQLQRLLPQLGTNGPIPTVIGGDFNVHSQKWYTAANVITTDNNQAEELDEWIEANGLTILNNPNVATRAAVVDGTLQMSSPDLLLVTNCCAELATVHPTDMSDHRMLSTTLGKTTLPIPHPKKPPKFSFQKADWARFAMECDLLLPQLPPSNPTQLLRTLTRAINTAARRAIPYGSHPTPKRGIWTPEMQSSSEASVNAMLDSQLHPADEDKLTLARTLRDEHRKIVSQGMHDHLQKTLSNLQPGCGMSWSYLKSRYMGTASAHQTPSLDTPTGKTLDPRRIADTLGAHYARHKSNGRPKKHRPRGTFHHITNVELTTAIAKLQTGKAPGPDSLHGDFMHHLGPSAMTHLHTLVNSSLRTGIVPQGLKAATIVPIPKPGKPPTVDGFRPISLTSSISKILERIITCRLLHTWKPHRRQFAYKEQSTTVSELVELTDHITEQLATFTCFSTTDGIRVYDAHHRHRSLMVCVDMSAAFDMVSHKLLLQLLHGKTDPYSTRWIRNWLSGRTATTKVGTAKGRSFAMKAGVPQGSVAGPVLFLLYTTLLLEALNEMEGIEAFMYADDLTIVCSGPVGTRLSATMQGALGTLEHWAHGANMRINPTKTTALLISLSTTTESDLLPPLQLNNTPVPVSNINHRNSIRLLGVAMDPRINFNDQHNANANATRFRTHQLLAIAGAKLGPSQSHARAFAKAYIGEKLLYATAATANNPEAQSLLNLGITHRRGMQIATGALRSTPPADLHLEANEFPLPLQILCKRLHLSERLHRSGVGWFTKPPPQPPPTGKTARKPPRILLQESRNKYLPASLHGPPPPTSHRSYAPHETTNADRIHFDFSALSPTGNKLEPNDARANNIETLANIRNTHSSIIATDGSLREIGNGRPTIVMAASILTTLPVPYTPDGPIRTEDDVLHDSDELIYPEEESNDDPHQEDTAISRPYTFVTQRCSPISTILTAELTAIKNGLLLFIKRMDATRPHRIAIISDSKSGLQRLSRGPLDTDPTDPTELHIWELLLPLADLGFHITMCFVYSHVGGAAENHLADSHASTLIPTINVTATPTEKDVKVFLTRAAREEYQKEHASPPPGYHGIRHALVGTRPTIHSDTCTITGAYISREQQVRLTRARTGTCVTHGTLFHRLRGTPNACRFCTEQPDPLEPPPEPPPPAATTTPRHTRLAIQCPHCFKKLASHTVYVKHVAARHPNVPPIPLHLVCPHCSTTKFTTPGSLAGHVRACRARHERHTEAVAMLVKKLIREDEEEPNAEEEPPPSPSSDESSDEPTEPPPPCDDILHALACTSTTLQQLRSEHRVEELLEAYGTDYFFSLPFCSLVEALYFDNDGTSETPTNGA